MDDEMTKALEAEDARQAKLHELLETIREQIRLEVLPEHRPEGLFQNIQNAVYAMRGRTPLMNDAVITSHLAAQPAAPVGEPMREALDWLVNCVECEVNLPGTTTVFQLRLAKAKEVLAAPPPSTQKVREDTLIECANIANKYDDCGGQFIAEKIRELALSTNPGEQE